MVEHYNLDVIISVGYRVKFKRGVEFCKWANSILKKYIIDRYAIIEKRLQALEKKVDCVKDSSSRKKSQLKRLLLK